MSEPGVDVLRGQDCKTVKTWITGGGSDDDDDDDDDVQRSLSDEFVSDDEEEENEDDNLGINDEYDAYFTVDDGTVRGDCYGDDIF